MTPEIEHGQEQKRADYSLVRGEDYTQTMRRHDHDAFVALIEKQRALHRHLEVVAQDLLTLGGKMHDHAAGFRHEPETCPTCAQSNIAGEAP